MCSCEETKKIWEGILGWLQVDHKAHSWNEKLSWIVQHRKGIWWRASMLKCAIAETVYAVWSYRNPICFGGQIDKNVIVSSIVDKIIHRTWMKHKLMKYVSVLIMP